MKWSVLGLLTLGLVAAFCAALLMLMGPLANAPQAEPAAPRDVTVMVAARDLPAMTVVESDAVIAKTIPADEAPAETLRDPVHVVGKVLMLPMVKGQAFSKKSFPVEGDGLHLATALPPGKRAVSVSLRNHAGLEGLLYPGAQVDVLASFQLPAGGELEGKAISTTLLQGVQVLAVHSESIVSASQDEATRVRPATRMNQNIMVTLLLDSRQAEAMQLATEHGTVSLALRNPLDSASEQAEATLLVEGRLAKLAEALSANVRRGETTVVQPGQYATTYSPPGIPGSAPGAPRSTPHASPAHWDVTILRGSQTEVRSFQIGEEAPPSRSDPAAALPASESK
jgi:pilus assembly protein CpaB